MPRPRILRTDDELHIRLGGRRTHEKAPSRGGPVRMPSKPLAMAITKVAFKPAGRAHGYAEHMQKDKHTEGDRAVEGYSTYMQHGRAPLFTAEGRAVDQAAFVERSHGDPRCWTIILSPLDGYRLNMEAYTRAFMAQVERDMGVQLDWLGAVHRQDTPHHHAHLLIRGQDLDGHEYRIAKSYITRGMATRAREIATRHLELGLTTGPERAHVPSRAKAKTQAQASEVDLQDRITTLQEFVQRHYQQADRDTGMER